MWNSFFFLLFITLLFLCFLQTAFKQGVCNQSHFLRGSLFESAHCLFSLFECSHRLSPFQLTNEQFSYTENLYLCLLYSLNCVTHGFLCNTTPIQCRQHEGHDSSSFIPFFSYSTSLVPEGILARSSA